MRIEGGRNRLSSDLTAISEYEIPVDEAWEFPRERYSINGSLADIHVEVVASDLYIFYSTVKTRKFMSLYDIIMFRTIQNNIFVNQSCELTPISLSPTQTATG